MFINLFLLFISTWGSENEIDLSFVLEPGTPRWFGDPNSEMSSYAMYDHQTIGWFGRMNSMPEHYSTHMDAPNHFIKDGITTDEIDPTMLVKRLARIDVVDEVNGNIDYAITKEDIQKWEEDSGKTLGPDYCVVMNSGWAQYWTNTDIAAGTNIGKDMMQHFPGFGEEATTYMVGKGVKCIGSDTLSGDTGNSSTFATHFIFLGAGGVIIENVGFTASRVEKLKQWPNDGTTWIAVNHLRFVKGTGAQLRLHAYSPDSEIAKLLEAGAEVVEMSHIIDNDIPGWYQDGPNYIHNITDIDAGGGAVVRTASYSLHEHFSTHIDAPSHRIKGGVNVDGIKKLHYKLAVINVESEAAEDRDYQVSVDDVKKWERKYGTTLDGEYCVLMDSGWRKKFHSFEEYMGASRDGEGIGHFHYPGFHHDAAVYLEANGVRCLGSDTLSTDRGVERYLGIDNTHNVILGAGGIIVEVVNNADLMQPCGGMLGVGLPNMKDSSGAQARLFGFNPKEACIEVECGITGKIRGRKQGESFKTETACLCKDLCGADNAQGYRFFKKLKDGGKPRKYGKCTCYKRARIENTDSKYVVGGTASD